MVGSKTWKQGYMIAPVKNFGQVQLSTNVETSNLCLNEKEYSEIFPNFI